jgi:hypothetical protein
LGFWAFKYAIWQPCCIQRIEWHVRLTAISSIHSLLLWATIVAWVRRFRKVLEKIQKTFLKPYFFNSVTIKNIKHCFRSRGCLWTASLVSGKSLRSLRVADTSATPSCRRREKVTHVFLLHFCFWLSSLCVTFVSDDWCFASLFCMIVVCVAFISDDRHFVSRSFWVIVTLNHFCFVQSSLCVTFISENRHFASHLFREIHHFASLSFLWILKK